jgi:ankyrin repeat protein
MPENSKWKKDTSHRELLDVFEKATETFKLCPNRVWVVAREKLPQLIPKDSSILADDKLIPNGGVHDMCTFDFCEYSQRDFTAVEQRHECEEKNDCVQLQGLFSRDILKEAADAGNSTVWNLDGKSMLEPPRPYMAISHVWSDGTGSGAWADGEVNICLYTYFQEIAKQFQCEGIWWDTICIPREKSARNKAIQKIQNNYQDARITLVHDCFLRNWEWVNAEGACFAILMSPWFSRGWTALELANSRKVKVVFKGPCGPLIKDLDEQILAKDNMCSDSHKRATDIIRNLRKGVSDLNGLLRVLGPRHTSWPKDIAIISGQLVGVEVAPKGGKRDIWQQDIYESILRKLGKVLPQHLFHNSATMSKVRWCPTSLFNMPIVDSNVMADSETSLNITEELDLIGEWKCIPVNCSHKERCVWNGIHPLIRKRLEGHLEDEDECVLLAERVSTFDTGVVDRALLVKKAGKGAYEYIGAVYFHPGLTENEGWMEEVRLLGDTDGRESNLGPNTQITKQEYSDSGIPVLISAASNGDENRVESLLDAVNPSVHGLVSNRIALNYAIWRGHQGVFHKLAKNIVERSEDLNMQDELGQRPLHLAAERGDEVIVSYLLRNGAHVELKAEHGDGQTALHRAAWGGSALVVKSLLNAGSNANAKDKFENIALHIAVEKGFEPVATLLIENGADVDAKGWNHLTPLHYAVMNRHEAVVKLLLDNGANVKAKDSKFGWTALHLAALNGHETVVKLLLDNGADIETKDDRFGWTALYLAAVNGHEDVVKLLVTRNAKVILKGGKDRTVSHIAIVNGHKKVVKLLANKDVKLKGKKRSRIALHCAVMSGPSAVFKALVDKGDVNLKNTGQTALQLAAENGYREVVKKLLVNKRAETNSKDDDSRTALHLAAANGHVAVVKLLVDTGVDAENNSRTALHVAAENGHLAVIKQLIENGANVNARQDYSQTSLHLAAANGHAAVIKLLIENGADINLKEKDHARTALHVAAANGHEAVVKQLVENGAAINLKENDGWTALHMAAAKGHVAVVKQLVENGAGINSATMDNYKFHGDDYKGQTALHLAAAHGHVAVIKLLIENGAAINLEEDDGWTALHVAATNGHLAVVKLLVDNGADTDLEEGYWVFDGGVGGDKGGDIGCSDDDSDDNYNIGGDKGDTGASDDSHRYLYGGRTALQLAVANGHKAVAELLASHRTPS